MKLSTLLPALLKAKEDAGDYDPDIEVWFRRHAKDEAELCEIVAAGQFSIVPDVTLDVRPKTGKGNQIGD